MGVHPRSCARAPVVEVHDQRRARRTSRDLDEAALSAPRLLAAEVLVRRRERDAPARRAGEVPLAHEEGLVDVLDRVALLADRRGDRVDPHRAAAERVEDDGEDAAVHRVEPPLVHLEPRERRVHDRLREPAVALDLREVAGPLQEPDGDARRSARAPRELLGPGGLDGERELRRRAHRDLVQLRRLVVAEPLLDREAVPERRREEARARRRAHEGEPLELHLHRLRPDAGAEDDVEAEVLHRRVERLLHRRGEPVDLVDEEDVARGERGEEAGEVALLHEGGAARHVHRDAQVAGEDVRERGLAEAGRPGEEDVVERVAPRLRRRRVDLEVPDDLLLPDVLLEGRWAERLLEPLLAFVGAGRDVAQGLHAHGGGTVSRGGDAPVSAGSPAHQLQRVAEQLVDLLAFGRVAEPVHRAVRLRRLVAEPEQRVAELLERARPRRRPRRTRGAGEQRELLLQLDHEPLRGLLPDAGDLRQPRHVRLRDRLREVLRLDPREDVLRRPRPDPLHVDERSEDRLLVLRREPVQLDRVLPHVRERAEGRRLAVRRELGERHGREVDEVADAAHVEDGVVGALLGHLPGEAGDHGAARWSRREGRRRARASAARSGESDRRTARRARWQTASASASSESSAEMPRRTRAVRSICSFEARPWPVKASFTSEGWYSNTVSPARAAAASATPRAWPRTSAERGETPAKTCSIETSSGRERAITSSSPSRIRASRSARGSVPATRTPESMTRSRPPSRATTP